ncbi:CD63 antigen [Patella vulgata]|uniref:CD63 antigen n=1 Tax=Patella vulgata TaxID=6465 RepID=UPI00217FF03F|nr:CD63 antigen [Patella vulgata]
MVEGGMRCIKLLLFVFNLLFVLAGIGLIGAGSYVQIKLTNYNDFLGNQYTGPGILLIIVGVIIFGIAFFGCCGAVKENYCLVMTFAVLLSIIFILEIAGGIAGFVLKDQLDKEVKDVLNKKIKDYKKNDTAAVEAFDELQREFECCGVKDKTDWSGSTIPASCCVKGTETGNTCPSDKAYPEGCDSKFISWIQDKILIIGGIGIGLAFVQIVGICFSCCLARAIRKEYEVV